MAREEQDDWHWGFAALLMWFGFFAVGLFPEYFYYFLRDQGRVVTYSAMVNSPYLLYFAQIAYLYAFICRASRGAGLGPVVSQILAVQLAMVGLLAFLPNIRLEEIPQYMKIGMRFERWLILGVCSLKIASWLYLLSLLCRYYLWSGGEVFRQMVPVLPSSQEEEAPKQP